MNQVRSSLVEFLRKGTRFIFDRPFPYEFLRSFFLGGLPTNHLLELLEPNGSDVILDVGCGTGFLAETIPFAHYVGIDNNPRAIMIAQKRKIPNAVFLFDDIRNFEFERYQPTKVVLYGVLHHLSDENALHLLKTLASCTKRYIVSLDIVYLKYHIINNVLAALDRGRFVRTVDGTIALVNQAGMKVERKLLKYANTLIAKYLTLRFVSGGLGAEGLEIQNPI